MDEPTAAGACYWRNVVKFINENAANDGEKHTLLDTLIPSLLQLSDYVFQYVSTQ